MTPPGRVGGAGLLVPRWQFRGPSTAGGRGDSGLERLLWVSGPWRCDGSGHTGSLERPQLAGLEVGGGWRSCWFSSARPGSSAYLAPSWPDGDFVSVGMCLPHTQTGRHTLRSPPCDHPSRGAWHSTVCCLGDSLGLCPRALPREEYSRDDKAAQSLRDGPVPAPPAIDSRAEEPSPEVTCLKSPNAGARAAQLQACRLSAVSLPRG